MSSKKVLTKFKPLESTGTIELPVLSKVPSRISKVAESKHDHESTIPLKITKTTKQRFNIWKGYLDVQYS